MPLRNLKALLRPKSIAVLGATERPHAPGSAVMRNLLQAGFAGPIMPVTREHASVAGVLAYPDVASLPITPDLALVCSAAETVHEELLALGRKGTRAACVMTPALRFTNLPDGRTAFDALKEAARATGIRVLGPNSMGLQVPGLGLDASYAPQHALPGNIAFVAQSGALCSAVLDWASGKHIGFSHFIHTGDGGDVGFRDILDYLTDDRATRAILLHIETIDAKRGFMSAARAAARNKPLLVIKSGRSAEGARAVAAHAMAMTGSDAVFDAAIRRAGMLRVTDIEEIFGAVETLARARPLRGRRLAIVTNGGGLGIIAADNLGDGGGQLAELSPEVFAALDAFLPKTWSKNNPIDIGGYADGARYVKALEVLIDSKEVDAVLVMHAPFAISDPSEIALAVIKLWKERPNANLMTCWVGGEKVAGARRLFADAAVPSFETPRAAIEGYLHLLEFRKNQEVLMEVPPSVPTEFTPDTQFARTVVAAAMERGDTWLNQADTRGILRAYGIPGIETRLARDPAEAGRIAGEMGGAVALKIASPEVLHKSDVGGVALGLVGEAEVREAAEQMLARVKGAAPDARLDGFVVQRMATRRPGTLELFIGVATDPIFGPAIVFGKGGVAAEVIGDRAIGLPPLNLRLAADLVDRTEVARLLQGYRGRPPADMEAVRLALVRVSQMVVELPELLELDINPILADSEGVVALDARVRLGAPPPKGQRLAIRPYPSELEEPYTLKDGSAVMLRPIRPEDEPNHHTLIAQLTPEDSRFRFFGLVHGLPHTQMARLVQIDYDREMVFIAERRLPDGACETLAEVRTVADPDNEQAEFAIVVRSDLTGTGLGGRLMHKMIDYCRSRGTRTIVGEVLRDNLRMIRFCKHLGFTTRRSTDDDADVEVVLQLQDLPKA